MKIERMNKGSWGKVRAFFDLTTEEGFIIKGFRLVEGINGLFVSMPSQKGQDGEYYDTVLADRVLRDKISQMAIQEYGQEIMAPPMGMDESFPPPPPTPSEQPTGVPAPAPFSDDDIPF
ncbi:MAG: septation protein SpoVG family protein [Candidatus Marinimicrobia bacterium]|nr:septation protein SpoVG family protein [Candidatus Neomarinimicrobiota bacterium]MDP6852673.1 septation protein SpoVG family protein [Candidatus Neomarinimicrobiota bacterium]